MKLVLDSSAWYAYISENDTQKEAATLIVRQNPELIVPYPVFEELAALVHKRKGKATSIKFVGRLLQSNLSLVTYISDTDNQEIWQLYQELPNKVDYVDASVIWLSRKLDLPIFTFDRHLRSANLNLNYLPK